MAKFMQYGIVAAKQALDDAAWYPEDSAAQEMTVGTCRLRLEPN